MHLDAVTASQQMEISNLHSPRELYECDRRVSPATHKSSGNSAAASKAVILNTIQGWKWFAYVPLEAQEWLAGRAILKRYSKGAVVFSAGEPIRHVHGVVSGNFRLFIGTEEGNQIILDDPGAGSWFVHWGSRQDARYKISCACQRDALVVAIAYCDILEFSRRWPEFYRGLYEELNDRARITNAQIELFMLHSISVRLAAYLLRMAHQRSLGNDRGPIFIDMGINQTEVAARIGSTRQRVNYFFNSWKKRGLIESTDSGIFIRDAKGLQVEAKKSGFNLSAYLAA